MQRLFSLRNLGVLLTALAVMATAMPAFAQEAAIKIAVVDLELIVANSKAGKSLAEKLRGLQTTAAADVERLQGEARDIRQRIAEGANSLTDDKLAALQQEFEDKTIAIRRYTDDKQREGQKMQEEGLAAIEKQLEPVFEKVRADNGYDLILNKVPGVVVMAGERVEITKKVIEALNATGQ